MKVAGAIIAGGPAKRLGGVAKPFVRVGGLTIAERQLAMLRAAFPRVLVVANDPEPWAPFGVEVVPDRVADAGPMGGIHAALVAADDCDAAVCVGGDMPFVAPAVLAALRDRPPNADVVMARAADYLEVLCARYGRTLLPALEECLRAGRLALYKLMEGRPIDFIQGAELAALDPTGRGFINVNTPEDLRAAEALAATEAGPRR